VTRVVLELSRKAAYRIEEGESGITVTLEGAKATMGIGSGIVADSDPEREYDECLLKADFVRRALG